MTKITVDKALIEQAIDVINSECGYGGSNSYEPRAIAEALRTSLAEPALEPYGYHYREDPTKFAMPGSGFIMGQVPPKDTVVCIPLYTSPSPPAEVPLLREALVEPMGDRFKLTPIYSPPQLDEVIEGSASTHYEAWDSSIPSPTEGMNIVKRIHHVGGRNNAAGFVEFGSIQAVQALVRQVLRDLLPSPLPVVTLLTDDEKLRIALECNMRIRTGSGAIKYASAIEQAVLQKTGVGMTKVQ